MNKAKYTEWIDNYLSGELDDAGMLNFQAELKENKALAMEYQLEVDMTDILADADILDFKAKCIEAQKEVNIQQKNSARVIQMVRKYWYAAASIVLIIIIAGGLYLLNPAGYSNERLFKMYYKSGETISVSRSGNVNMVEALIQFSKKDYQSASDLFDKILTTDPNNIAVKYYSGISNIEIKNYPKAIDMFKEIIADKNNLYVENAQWYLGLTFLINEQNNEAINEFELIANKSDHYYNSQAKSILEKVHKNEKNKEILNNLFFLILPF